MDLYNTDPTPTSSDIENTDEPKIGVKLQGDMCLDDSDPDLIMIWSKAISIANDPLLICWQVTDPAAEEMKNMVAEWEKFVVLTEGGKPLGTSRDFFLKI